MVAPIRISSTKLVAPSGYLDTKVKNPGAPVFSRVLSFFTVRTCVQSADGVPGTTPEIDLAGVTPLITSRVFIPLIVRLYSGEGTKGVLAQDAKPRVTWSATSTSSRVSRRVRFRRRFRALENALSPAKANLSDGNT